MTDAYPKEILDAVEKIKEDYKTSLANMHSIYNSMIDKNGTKLLIYENTNFNKHAFTEFKLFLEKNKTVYKLRYDPDDDDSMGFHFTRPYYEFTFSKENYPQKKNLI